MYSIISLHCIAFYVNMELAIPPSAQRTACNADEQDLLLWLDQDEDSDCESDTGCYRAQSESDSEESDEEDSDSNCDLFQLADYADNLEICFEDTPYPITLTSSDEDDPANDNNLDQINNKWNKEVAQNVSLPSMKRVHFGNVKVHRLIKWSFAYQSARKGEWEQAARDRERFTRLILSLQPILSQVLDPLHRQRVYNSRFSGQ